MTSMSDVRMIIISHPDDDHGRKWKDKKGLLDEYIHPRQIRKHERRKMMSGVSQSLSLNKVTVLMEARVESRGGGGG